MYTAQPFPGCYRHMVLILRNQLDVWHRFRRATYDISSNLKQWCINCWLNCSLFRSSGKISSYTFLIIPSWKCPSIFEINNNQILCQLKDYLHPLTLSVGNGQIHYGGFGRAPYPTRFRRLFFTYNLFWLELRKQMLEFCYILDRPMFLDSSPTGQYNVANRVRYSVHQVPS